MIHSIIQKSQLEGAHRLDAEYYQPEYLKYSEQLNRLKLADLNFLTSKVDVGFVSSMVSHFQDKGVPLLRTQNVCEFFIDAENDVVYIDEEFHKKLRKSQIFPGYLLLARSGSIGNVGIVPENFPVANSADIILIKTKSDKITPEFLAAFLNSKYGRYQVERGSSGGLQGHINLFSLEKLLVPIIDQKFQEQIAHLIRQGLFMVEESRNFYQQAENLLLEELGLKDFKVEDDLSFVVNFSGVKSAHRIDAEYFQPKYDKLISKLKDQKSKPLTEVIDSVAAKSNPQTEPDKIFRYVELANIDSSIGIIDGFSEVLGKEAPSRAKRILKVGDVIVSSVEGSLEKVALVNKEQEDHLASTGFFQFRSKEILPEVLLVLARSIVLRMQLEKQCAGTILTAVSEKSLKNIVVPILLNSTQQKIADLVRQSHEARKKAKELLEKAKRKVENMIEKGGE